MPDVSGPRPPLVAALALALALALVLAVAALPLMLVRAVVALRTPPTRRI